MTSSENLRQMLARFEIASPASPAAAQDVAPASVNGVDLLRRLLQESDDAAAR